ncbi:hypothetical protein [Bosea sp. ASV33]|uniref:hypothetical protein n=1 Tax=Bosea sp. ASV33 TaxID=2795106 RepID=UPI0018EB3F66|nr:hypothetical protein [Bosea sp. ASV33]
MSQFDFGTIVPELTSGTQLADRLNQFRTAQNTNHSGPGRPVYVQAGMIWLDTSSEPWRLKLYDGADDIVFMQFDPAGNAPIMGLGGEIDAASAPSINLAQVRSNSVRITGTADIGSFGTATAGTLRFLQFTGALTLVQSADIDLPGGANLPTATGDRAVAVALGGSAWRVISYTRANGSTPVNRDASVAEYRGKAAKLVKADAAFAAAAYVPLVANYAIAPDLALGFNFKVQLTGAHVLAFPANFSVGQTGRIRVFQPGGCSLAYAGGYYFSNGVAPSLSAYAGWWFIDYFCDEGFVHLMASHL